MGKDRGLRPGTHSSPHPVLQPHAAPSPAVPTDLVRGIPFRREPGSFSGPGRPWRSNSDCESWRGQGYMEVLEHWVPSSPSSPTHPPPKPEVRPPPHVLIPAALVPMVADRSQSQVLPPRSRGRAVGPRQPWAGFLQIGPGQAGGLGEAGGGGWKQPRSGRWGTETYHAVTSAWLGSLL